MSIEANHSSVKEKERIVGKTDPAALALALVQEAAVPRSPSFI